MQNEKIALHAHDFVITKKTYQTTKTLQSFYKVLATDTYEGTEFVVAVEARDYPFAGVMFHPETQNIRIMGGDETALAGKLNT